MTGFGLIGAWLAFVVRVPTVRLRARFQTAIVLTLLATSVNAMSIRELRGLELSDKEHGEIYVQYYLVGVMEGALEANAHATRSGGKAQICVSGRKVEPRMAKSLFDGELRRNAGLYEADMPVQLVVLNALIAAYSC